MIHIANNAKLIQSLIDTRINVVFVDTDALPARESRAGDLIQNEVEGRLIHQMVSCLIRCGMKEEDLAVITPYRQQIKLLSRMLKDMSRVEVLTADKSQGRDKDCVLISMVRSNEVGKVSANSKAASNI